MNEHTQSRDLGGIVVSETSLRTSRQTVMLRDIDHVECRRPLLVATLPVAIGMTAITMRFADLLTWIEIATLIVPPIAATAAAAEIGVLRLSSLSLRNQAIWGRHRDLQRARAAVEAAMVRNKHPPNYDPKFRVTDAHHPARGDTP